MENKLNLRSFLGLFLISYVFFYILPFPFDENTGLPKLEVIGQPIEKGLELSTEWIGKMLGVENVEKVDRTGSGDTAYDYVELITVALLALIASLLLFLFGLKRKGYDNLYRIMIVYTRYFVGLMLITYGYVKLVEGQFIIPGPGQLEKTYGDSSPMNLLWTFMGYSRSYTFFTGFAECLAGGLLLFRRTTYLGSLLSMAVMINVVLLNFSYDVPVKLFSSHLFLMSLLVLMPAIPSITAFFFGGKSAGLPDIEPLSYPKTWMRPASIAFKYILIAGFVVLMIVQFQSYDIPKPGPFTGTYETEEFVVNRDTFDQVKPDSVQWKKLMLDRFYSKIERMDGQSTFYRYDIDSVNQEFRFYSFQDSSDQLTFQYELLPDDLILLNGVVKSDTIWTKMKIKRQQDYPLINRGFHWVSQYPFNR